MRVCFVRASQGNLFFDEIAAVLRAALETHGLETVTADDHFPSPEPDLVYAVVPHEFWVLTEDRAHPTPAHLARTVALCTEQPGTSWFELTSDFANASGAVVDINRAGVAELRRRGVTAEHLQLGYSSLVDRWGGDPARERPIMTTFMGGFTQRRAEALAACAPVFRRHRAALHLVSNARPHVAGSRTFLAGGDKWERLSRSEILLNVHRDELGYFEWARVVEAIANGAVLLTEHSSGFEPLVPGEHLAIADRAALPATLAALAEDDETRVAMRERAYRFLREELPLERTVQPLIDAVERVAANPMRRAPRSAPRPKPAPMPPSGYARATRPPAETDYLRMALKHLMLHVQTVERKLERTVNGAGQRLSITDNEAYARAAPRVSVVLTLYNYAAVVGEAVRSVALSSYRALELVVVDDASTDGSREAVREAIAAHPWLATRLILRHANRGLAAGRNVGIECARGELIFILDADNQVEPNGIADLVEALDGDPDAAFAYGILEQFGRERGLLSWQGWDPEELRIANFIDAMALLRRDAVRELGGYTEDSRLYGLEDFDLWCRVVQQGSHGAFVPRPVGRYRTSGASMISLANIDDRAAWVALASRSPWLAER